MLIHCFYEDTGIDPREKSTSFKLIIFYDDRDTDVETNIFVKKSVVMNQNSIRVMSII